MPESEKYPTDPKHDVDGDAPDGCTHVSWYTLDSWENDLYLVERSPERTARIEAESFRNMKHTGVKPEDLPNPETRARYMEFLKQCT